MEYKYEGEVDENGLPHGKGVLSDDWGEVYDGEFVHGKREGMGREYDEYGKVCYHGEWKNDVREGNGTEYICGQIVYDGEWKNDKANGFGRSFDAEGEILYEGLWENDEPKETK